MIHKLIPIDITQFIYDDYDEIRFERNAKTGNIDIIFKGIDTCIISCKTKSKVSFVRTLKYKDDVDELVNKFQVLKTNIEDYDKYTILLDIKQEDDCIETITATIIHYIDVTETLVLK